MTGLTRWMIKPGVSPDKTQTACGSVILIFDEV
jgi:hypothetical protein